jgi:sulfate adenylyltransferase subunit 1
MTTATLDRQPALRFLTAGSVDDGKSTLIGRLLYDSRALLTDQLSGVQGTDERPVDLALLTDGLEAEREQGITIDVAWRYFATARRKFVIADAPGHEQYTRNMVTAAAGSDAALVLVDVTKLDLSLQPITLLPQTRRHALLAQLLRVRSIVFVVNKLDAVADPGAAFSAVSQALQAFALQAGIVPAATVPLSALHGHNLATPWQSAWYSGPSLLQVLERLPSSGRPDAVADTADTADTADVTAPAPAAFSLPVQYVSRGGAGTGEQPRTLWGRVARGEIRLGDAVTVFPSGQSAHVVSLEDAAGDTAVVSAGRSAGIVLDRQLDVSRGDWLLAPGIGSGSRHFEATLAWLDTEAALPGRRYKLRHGHRWVQARLVSIRHRLDIGTLAHEPAERVEVNQIAEVVFELQQPLPLAPYAHNAEAGAMIVVDPATHRTSGALLVQRTLADLA